MSSGHPQRELEVKAFAARLSRSDREAAEDLWAIFAETKAVLAAVHATWVLAITGSEPMIEQRLCKCHARVRDLLPRLERVRLRQDAPRRSFAASLRDFARALDANDAATLLATSAVAYEAGRDVARALWAFELAPEGAALAAEVASAFDQ